MAAASIAVPAYLARQKLADAREAVVAESVEPFLALTLVAGLASTGKAPGDTHDWSKRLAAGSERIRWAGIFDSNGRGLEFRQRFNMPREQILAQVDLTAHAASLKPLDAERPAGANLQLWTIPLENGAGVVAAVVDAHESALSGLFLQLAGLAGCAVGGLLLSYGWYRLGIVRPMRRVWRKVAEIRAELAEVEAATVEASTREIGDALTGLDELMRELKQWRAEAKTLRRSMDTKVETKTREAAKAVRQAEHEADTDVLTGLRNRRALERELPVLFERERRAGRELTAAWFDLNNLKEINDTLGHQVGDDLIAAVGELVLASLRRGVDIAARCGGDEFVIIMPNTTIADAMKAVIRFHELFAQRLRTVGAHAQQASVSVGLAAMIGDEIGTHDELLRLADEAMYLAKRGGKCVATVADLRAVKAAG